MSDQQRQRTIVQILEERPFVSVKDLTATVGVSAATIRRDIEKLSGAGLAQKVHGGIAALTNGGGRAPVALPFILNRDIAVAAKQAIARRAGELVRDGSLIIIHGGSTCFHFGTHIANRNVRAFTNSMPLAAYLAEHGTCQLKVGGGDLHREPGILYEAARGGEPFYASQFFVSALGVSAEGLLESHPLLVRFINDMVDLANEIIVLVDSRKFSERPPTVALPLHRVTRLITDDGLSDKDAKMLEERGVDVLIAKGVV
ncbi:DeoR/GlpR family DNA-binding transcription regulator [Pseudotabrizicola sp. 4114]|uniref:DeoR/GlpR family DNA-binding transcription regulator n=1 Tax=Pseudotabrizicola sp. 4114 TaxID=2817731 RepID=UPI0028678B40|nr:DeoR family ulaG and ulaABCDEF operon transcriptional repressor [Pseudorhodobacter sp. 4114]